MSFTDSPSFDERDSDNENESYEYPLKRKIPKLSLSAVFEDEPRENKGNDAKPPEPKKSVSKSFGKRYMSNFGHKEGLGLGKHQDGIVEPVQASKQKGTRGLGFKPVDLEETILKYDPSLLTINVDEEVIWLKNKHEDSFSLSELEKWMKTGPPLESITEESSFCDAEIICNILKSKNVLGSINKKEKTNGRRRSNPFESIQKGIFLNRAAMKMANMDAILGRMFTEPRNLNDEKIIGSEDLLYFADVCAGPGGFSEYVLFRKKWRAKGFGFTLREQNDFTLDQFWAGPPETFEPHYGIRGDGNVYIPENILSFKDHVLKSTDGRGVHFMMADAGVPIEEGMNDQELICKKLYLCQCLVALLIVRIEGHFVVKLFDLFTPFSAGLVYLMYRSFASIAIIKPNTSRPANSERYLVCKHKREDCTDITAYLFRVNEMVPLFQQKDETDVTELVPLKLLMKDPFFEYLRNSNNSLGKNQAMNLVKMAAFAENTELKEERQQELRKECLTKWNIPDEARAEPKKFKAETKCTQLLGISSLREFESDIKKNTISDFESFKKHIMSVYDWRFVVFSGEKTQNRLGFYLGLGRNNVHKFTPSKGWAKWDDGLNATSACLCLPANTLVYGEVVSELFGSGRSQTKKFAFHIIDGLFLGGDDIRNLPIQERWKMCRLFAKSLNKESFPVRAKEEFALEDIHLLRENLVLKATKSSTVRSLCVPVEDCFWKAGGIMFFRDTKEPWHRFFSFSRKANFVHNTESDKKYFEEELIDSQKNEIYSHFDQSFRKGMIWWWDSGMNILDDENFDSDANKMNLDHILEYVNRKRVR